MIKKKKKDILNNAIDLLRESVKEAHIAAGTYTTQDRASYVIKVNDFLEEISK